MLFRKGQTSLLSIVEGPANHYRFAGEIEVCKFGKQATVDELCTNVAVGVDNSTIRILSFQPNKAQLEYIVLRRPTI